MPKRERCEQCLRPQSHCYCPLITKVDSLWPVQILQHPQEAKHALGTARIAALCLNNCQLEIASSQFENFIHSLVQPALIYPGVDSKPLETLIGTRPRPLLFLDATWRKSRRFLLESPALASLPQYSLASPPASRYRIRREPEPEALSTLEAIVHSLALLEANSEKFAPLLHIMDSLVDEQITQMGTAVYARNYEKN